MIKGLITKIESKDFYVLTGQNKTYRCSLRGKFKKVFALKKDKLFLTDIAAVGDHVEFDINKNESGVIHSIKQRTNYLSRKAPKQKGAGYRGERLEQIIAANIDQVFVICSIFEPDFNNRTLDRFLAASESAGIKSFIVINKSDLDDDNKIEKWKELYENTGYEVIASSIITKMGMETIKNFLPENISLFWGQSGVGKSSILNVIFPDLNLKIGDISNYTGKGIHTTVTSNMIPIDNDTFIIDTPGVREIEPYGIRKEDLAHYFIEFTQFLKNCRYNSCIHDHEPDCGVITAVENNRIPIERYDSYLRLLATIEDDLHF
ncbi:MAG: ribosome small subunit-dependent GTPase A [Bacteroidetes bacterium]|nr:ribosome small subunit-dependent GTPase A [Bacteroidota bacterium]